MIIMKVGSCAMANLKDLKAQAISKYIRNCVPGGRRYRVYTYENIPNSVLNNALSYYANSIPEEQVLGIIDTSFMKNGKSGIVFGEYGYSVSEATKKYNEYPRLLGDDFEEYNVDAVNTISKMMCELSQEYAKNKERNKGVAKKVLTGLGVLVTQVVKAKLKI